MKDYLDWDGALRLSMATTPGGPAVTGAARRAVVALLRRSALEAPAWVGEITGLHRAADRAAATTQVLVVDRAGWRRAAADSLAAVLDGVPEPSARGPRLPAGVGRATSTAQMGAALGFLSTNVLGQVTPWPCPGDDAERRMLLVAPNVLAIERRLELDVLDFPAWVTLHETAHAVQLCAAPWLADHLLSELNALIGSIVARDVGPSEQLGTLLQALREVRADDGDLLSALLTPEETERLARLVAVTTLLEGHAEAVLDAVTPARMPSVHRLRATMVRSRRPGAGGVAGVDALLHRLTGLDAKLGQYASGVRFVRAVVGRMGHDGLNAVWAGPEHLPTPNELTRPEAWVARVHG